LASKTKKDISFFSLFVKKFNLIAMSSIVILWVGFKLLLKHLGEKTRKLSLKLSCDIFPVLQFIYALLVMFRVVQRLQKCFSLAVM